MLTWLADVFPFSSAAVAAGTGLLILKADYERMKRQNLRAEAAFSRIVGWFFAVGGLAVWAVANLLAGLGQAA